MEVNVVDMDREYGTNQMSLDSAMEVTIDMMVREQPRCKHTLSRADIILIFTVYGSLDVFFKLWTEYLSKCQQDNFQWVRPPHFFLKYQIG